MHNDFEEVLNTSLLYDYNASPLNNRQASYYGISLNSGEQAWLISTEIEYKNKKLSFILKVTSDYPFKVPDIYTYPAIEILKYPHVEINGKLCIWPETKQFDSSCQYYFQELLKDAHQLVIDILGGNLTEDFTKGFNSYWNINVDPLYSVHSLCDVSNLNSREVYTYCVNKTYIFADTKEKLNSYLINIGLKAKYLIKSFLMQVNTPWCPQDYPKNINDIFTHLSLEVGENEAAHLIYQSVTNKFTESPCLVMVNTVNGLTVCGLMMTVNDSDKKVYKQPKELEAIGNGFRKGRMNSLKNFIPRVKHKTVRQLKGQRIDPNWVLGRDCNINISELKNTTVAIIGLGSVGSHLLPLLARGGVQKFVLIDPDRVEAANIGRQWYGMHQIGVTKVAACNSELIKQFPWVNCQTYYDNWFLSKQAKNDLKNVDLIISATGSWLSDCALGKLSRLGELPPILWAFTESYGVATHAFYDPTNNFELETLFDETGGFLNAVASFNYETLKALPSCGGYFQSYGMGELIQGHAMIGQLALNALLGKLSIEKNIYHIWVGDKQLIDVNNGNWNEKFTHHNNWCFDGNFLMTEN